LFVKAVKISTENALKIFRKHGVLLEEISFTLGEDSPLFRKVGGEQYLAIGLSRSRYLTIFFRYSTRTKEAEMTTAYPSDSSQIRFYRRQLGTR
jgi:hypothetical protein